MPSNGAACLEKASKLEVVVTSSSSSTNNAQAGSVAGANLHLRLAAKLFEIVGRSSADIGVGRIASVLLSLEKLKCINSCRVCVPRGSYHPRDYRGRVCVTVSRVDKCGSKGPFEGDWRTMSNARHCKWNQNGLPEKSLRELPHCSNQISWNLFVGRLNYSCQREDDGDLQTMTDPQTLGDEELLRLTTSQRLGCLTVPCRRHQEPVYRFVLQMSGIERAREPVQADVPLGEDGRALGVRFVKD
jgi:hypothetical protein